MRSLTPSLRLSAISQSKCFIIDALYILVWAGEGPRSGVVRNAWHIEHVPARIISHTAAMPRAGRGVGGPEGWGQSRV